jgi:1-deoxy-D-xylulose-5-phosphate synthase
MRFVKPLDVELLHEIFSKFSMVVTVEDGSLSGGFGSSILEFMADNDYKATVKRLGIPDKIIEHGDPEQLYKECKYDSAGIYNTVLDILEEVYN